MRARNALLSADSGDLGAQSDLIGTPEWVGIEGDLADQNGGYLKSLAGNAW